jgi:hypothetical protein
LFIQFAPHFFITFVLVFYPCLDFFFLSISSLIILFHLFFIKFWSSFFLLLFSYPFLDLFFCPFYFILFFIQF